MATTTLTPDATAAGTLRIAGDLTVHRLGYGAMRLTGKGVWGPPEDRGEALRVLRRAVELGIDFIDTADSYGPHVNEELIAEALHPYPEGLVIATKAGFERPRPGKWEENGRPEHLRAACEGSLKRLKVERIDLYQLHRIDPAVPADDQFGTLVELRDEGKVRHLGLSEVGVDDVRRAGEHFRVATVQNQYNLSYRKWDDVVDHCAAEGIGFIPWFPLASSDLAGGGEQVLREVADQHSATPAQVALAWLLHRSPAMLPIPGTSSVDHLEENTAAAGLELDDEDLARLNGLGGG
jgi:aryl-alcohol dehydrogenase-like predicted oxidoreductase